MTDDAPAPGTIVRAATALRPTGKVDHEGRHHQARSEGEWFGPGDPVAVLRRDGNGLVVGPPDRAPTIAAAPAPEPPMPAEPTPTPTPTPTALTASDRADRYLAGLIAFAALGTFVGALTLMGVAFAVRPRRLLALLPVGLCGGAGGGVLFYHLLLAGWAVVRRLIRPRGRDS